MVNLPVLLQPERALAAVPTWEIEAEETAAPPFLGAPREPCGEPPLTEHSTLPGFPLQARTTLVGFPAAPEPAPAAPRDLTLGDESGVVRVSSAELGLDLVAVDTGDGRDWAVVPERPHGLAARAREAEWAVELITIDSQLIDVEVLVDEEQELERARALLEVGRLEAAWAVLKPIADRCPTTPGLREVMGLLRCTLLARV